MAYTQLCIIRTIKPVEFAGTALDDLRAFPETARREAGYQIDKVQHGVAPDDWKPMSSIGAGVKEIRIRDASGAFRVIYLAKLTDAIMCCTASRRKASKPASRIFAWRASGSGN